MTAWMTGVMKAMMGSSVLLGCVALLLVYSAVAMSSRNSLRFRVGISPTNMPSLSRRRLKSSTP